MPSLTIYKYPLKLVDQQVLILPMGSSMLSFHNQNEVPTIWVRVDTDVTQFRKWRIAICGTGHPAPDEAHFFIGTAQFANGLVWHCFAKLDMSEQLQAPIQTEEPGGLS